MEAIKAIIEANQISVMLLIGLLAVLSLIIMLINWFLFKKIERRYRVMLTGMDDKNLEEILETNLKNTNKIFSKTLEIESEYKGIRKMAERAIQRVGVVRFNAFDNTGSDLSFAIALLDYNGDGIVLSGLFGRDETRTYAKPVTGGASTYHLSDEESEALRIAMDKK